jgi:hypothetical protein
VPDFITTLQKSGQAGRTQKFEPPCACQKKRRLASETATQ